MGYQEHGSVMCVCVSMSKKSGFGNLGCGELHLISEWGYNM